MKVNLKKKTFGYILEPCIEIWQIFVKFGKNFGIENFKRIWF
jgi:hypothetical protein